MRSEAAVLERAAAIPSLAAGTMGDTDKKQPGEPGKAPTEPEPGGVDSAVIQKGPAGNYADGMVRRE